mmetsp:Transcript_5641/g.7063  ORF Transcript_5641/g.7063 Transcript_5641/m.7063 type:complete len:81 (-) Transcript_5641:4-246(-)
MRMGGELPNRLWVTSPECNEDGAVFVTTPNKSDSSSEPYVPFMSCRGVFSLYFVFRLRKINWGSFPSGGLCLGSDRDHVV